MNHNKTSRDISKNISMKRSKIYRIKSLNLPNDHNTAPCIATLNSNIEETTAATTARTNPILTEEASQKLEHALNTPKTPQTRSSYVIKKPTINRCNSDIKRNCNKSRLKSDSICSSGIKTNRDTSLINDNSNMMMLIPSKDGKFYSMLPRNINPKIFFNEKRKENLKNYHIKKSNTYNRYDNNVNINTITNEQRNTNNSMNFLSSSPSIESKYLMKNVSFFPNTNNKMLFFEQNLRKANIHDDYQNQQSDPQNLNHDVSIKNNSLELSPLKNRESTAFEYLEQKPEIGIEDCSPIKRVDPIEEEFDCIPDVYWKEQNKIFNLTKANNVQDQELDSFSRNATYGDEFQVQVSQPESHEENPSPYRLVSAKINQDNIRYKKDNIKCSKHRSKTACHDKSKVSANLQNLINSFNHDNEIHHGLARRKSSSGDKKDITNNPLKRMKPLYQRFIKRTFNSETQDRLQTFERFAFNCNERDNNKDIIPFLKQIRSIKKPMGSMSIVDLWPTRLHRDILKQIELYKPKKIVEKFSFYSYKNDRKKGEFHKQRKAADNDLTPRKSENNEDLQSRLSKMKQVIKNSHINKKENDLASLNQLAIDLIFRAQSEKCKSQDFEKFSTMIKMLKKFERENTEELRELIKDQKKSPLLTDVDKELADFHKWKEVFSQ